MQECVSATTLSVSSPAVSAHCITYRTFQRIELDRVPYGSSDINNQMPNLPGENNKRTRKMAVSMAILWECWMLNFVDGAETEFFLKVKTSETVAKIAKYL